jgi:hypothetical protein
VFLLGCATSFQGEARFPQGPRGCFNKCQSVGMEMSSFVYVGEYSTGCVCTLKRAKTAAFNGAASTTADDEAASAATSAAAVGVILKMRAIEAGIAAGTTAAVMHY